MIWIENIIILQNKVDLIKSEVAMKHYGRVNIEFVMAGGKKLTVSRVDPTVHPRHGR